MRWVTGKPATHPDDFRTGVVRGPATRLEHGPHGLEGGHAEVGHLDVVLVVQEEVLRFQVPMAEKNED